MSNEKINSNGNYEPLSEEIRGPQDFVNEETKQRQEDMKLAKELLNTEILDDKTYFEFEGQQYYFTSGTRNDGHRLKTFTEERKMQYLVEGLSTLSKAKKLILNMPDLFPPTIYKVKTFTQGSKTIKETEYLTKEEEEKIMELYNKRITDIAILKKAAKIPASVELVIKNCESATNLLENTAEMRAFEDYQEWAYLYNVFYASGDKKDQRVYKDYEEFCNDKKGVPFYTAVTTAITESFAEIKKKLISL